jgi:hypothetical protein
MKHVTVDEVMSWEPCEAYTRRRVTELFVECGVECVVERDEGSE